MCCFIKDNYKCARGVRQFNKMLTLARLQARLNNKGYGSAMLKRAWHCSHLAPCLTLSRLIAFLPVINKKNLKIVLSCLF